jgi:hypothetical protein
MHSTGLGLGGQGVDAWNATAARRPDRVLVERWGWGGAPSCPASLLEPALKAGFAVVMVGGVVSDAGDPLRGLGEPRRMLCQTCPSPGN